jgi:GT2 family glycosyltransferase
VPLQHYIDQPGDWTRLSRCLIVRGWCFGAAPGAVRGVRLRAGKFTLAGAIGFPRPDVKAALPAAPDLNTGFEIRGTLPGGKVRVVIEAQLADGTWTPLLDRVVRVRRQFLPLWLGGGDWMELMFFQMPAHMAHAPRPVAPERFPPGAGGARPKLSIVTPSYQQARYLGQTMRSVLDQPGVACEYVVRDGDSTDGSKALIERMAAEYAAPAPGPAPRASRLTAWSSAPDGGQADAIAQGFAQTSGGPDDIMAWINSDDYYLPGALAFVADYFARHPDVDMVYGHRIVVNEDAQEVARWFLPPHDPEVLRLNDFVPQETLFWRRRIWDRVGGLDPAFQFALDWDLLLRCQAAGAKIVRLPYFLACFRVHAAQKTTAFMHSTGQAEITRLRERTHGRSFPAREIEGHPLLLRYLRQSAWIEFLWRRLGVRAR